MIQIQHFCRYFFCFSILLPAVLWADPTVSEPSDNTSAAQASTTPAAAEALVNTTTAESASNTFGAQTSAVLSEVVVTANRVGVPVENVTSSSTVITSQDFERKQAGTVLDALQSVPGLNIAQTGNPGETASVYIRGNDSENTLILFDGIPLNDPSGAPFDYEYMDGLSLDGVKRIEVIEGPQSTLWGSNAIGGVINIVPESGPAPLGGSVLVEGGSYGTSHESVSAQGGDNEGYFHFDASHFNTAGFPALNPKALDAADAPLENPNPGSVNNGDDNNTALLKLGSNLASNLNEEVLIRYSQSDTSIDTDNANFVLVDDPDYFSLQKQFMADSHTDWKLLGGDWEQVLTTSFVDDNRIFTGIPNPYVSYYEQGSYDGQTAQINWQNNLRLFPEEKLVVGLQDQQEWAGSSDTSGLGVPYFASSLPGQTIKTGSVYAESQTSVDNRFFLNLSGRWENNSQYGTHTTYQIGTAYVLPGFETKLKANYGTGFLAPSLFQLYAPVYGYPNLQPETSLGYDFGFEQPLGNTQLKIGADYFDNDLTNLITYNPSTFVSANIGQARTYGVESFLEFRGIQNLVLKGTYTYTNARNLTADAPLVRRPQNLANADVDYQWGVLGLGTSLIYAGTSFDTDFSGNSVLLPAYFLLNLRASYQVNPDVKLFGRVDNLFNQFYEEVYGYSTAGLSAYGGIKVSL